MLFERHPLPWAVAYDPRCKEWHPKSQPVVVDANGVQVIRPWQTVDHPGHYDEFAELLVQQIVESVNEHAVVEAPVVERDPENPLAVNLELTAVPDFNGMIGRIVDEVRARRP